MPTNIPPEVLSSKFWQRIADGLTRKAKKRAKAKQLPFDLNRDWVYKMLRDNDYACMVTGAKFRPGEKAYGPYVPTLDRIVPKLGYVQKNVQVVCLMYNGAKGANTHEDVLQFAKMVVAAEARTDDP